jgi:hypothetical protein
MAAVIAVLADDPLAPHLSMPHPPPWLWLAPGRLWHRRGVGSRRQFPRELLQQLHWWLARPWLYRRRSSTLPALPWSLSWRACWLNSYRPAEVARWRALGVNTWAALSQQLPDSLVAAIHAERRATWPQECQPALSLLSDKAALLELTPPPWRPAFAVLDHSSPGSTPAPPEPPWWNGALRTGGVVLKPQRGHGGRAVLRFRLTPSGLEQQALVRRLPADAPTLSPAVKPDPAQLLQHWQQLCRTQEAALAAPYLEHSPALPPADPAAVLRVITARASTVAPISVQQAWLEAPLATGRVAFLSLDGTCLPMLGNPLTAEEQAALEHWQDLLRAGVPPCLAACLEAVTALHAQLPPIDQVAWDWIPADPHPLLLEGNGGFGLLVPQLLHALHRL